METVKTFTATIYVGTFNRDTGEAVSVDVLKGVCSAYCDRVGLCVTVTETEFIYTSGREKGVAVGLINYPRFPNCPVNIRDMAVALAAELQAVAKQQRVSVVMPDETVMLLAEGVSRQ